MEHIEVNSLYTEGLYRKPGITRQVNKLKAEIEKCHKIVDLDDYSAPVHASTLKSIFRDMIEPLLTFERYDDFVRVGDMEDEPEQGVAVYSIIVKLPTKNYLLLQRLMFHLARYIIPILYLSLNLINQKRITTHA